MGGYEDDLLGLLEPSLKYHPNIVRTLTFHHYLVEEQCQVVSLTGAVASKKVTEAYKGFLKSVRNRL